MKKTLTAFLTAVLLCTTANAQVVGSVLSTDIQVYIDYILVPSYNIGGSTVVLVRDLENYGYTVFWDEGAKRVDFFRDFSKPQEPVVPSYNGIPVGTKLFDIHSTDIRVFFRGNEIPAYNLNGRTAVRLRDINAVGDVLFDPVKKQADIFNTDVEFFDDEIEYIKAHFFGNLLLLAEGDYLHQRVLSAMENRTFGAALSQEFAGFSNRLSAAADAFKVYKEPYGFSNSAMELWWAMVNTQFATESLENMILAYERGGNYSAAVGEYNGFRADSFEQRRVALLMLDEDMLNLTMFW